MNWLIVDAGNSRLKWARWDGFRLTQAGGIEYRQHQLPQLLARCWGELSPPQRIIVASVAGQQFDTVLADWCQNFWTVTTEFLTSEGRSHGVTNGYREAARLGVDRWAAIVAACHLHPERDLCIADCGTATTLDSVDCHGNHQGGFILPGLTLMQECLQHTAAAVPLRPPVAEPLRPGHDTRSAVAGGALLATTAALEQWVNTLDAAEGSEVTCIITGGAAPLLLPHLRNRWLHRPTLVLEGARILAHNSLDSR